MLKIKYTKNLTNQIFYFGFSRNNNYNLIKNWKKIIELKNPISTLDTYRLKKNKKGKIIIDLFKKYKDIPILIEFNDCKNIWLQKYKNTFPANIDTLFLTNFLRERKLSFVRSAIDVGCGQGFVGQYLLEKYHDINTLVFTDINPYAIKLAKINIAMIPKKMINKKKIIFNVSDTFDNIPKKIKFDLIVSNPPYVPYPKAKCVKGDGPYLGVYLLQKLIKESGNRLNKNGHLILNYSVISSDKVRKYLRNFNGKIIDEKTKKVSFWIKEILQDKKFLRFLIRKGLLEKKGDRYFQEIRVADIIFAENQ